MQEMFFMLYKFTAVYVLLFLGNAGASSVQPLQTQLLHGPEAQTNLLRRWQEALCI